MCNKEEEMQADLLRGECPDGIDWKAEYRALLKEMRTYRIDSYYRTQKLLEGVETYDGHVCRALFENLEKRLSAFGDDGWHGTELKEKEE